MILEVMGRDVGHIAIAAGIAGGADIILIPEIPFEIGKVTARLVEVRQRWQRNHALVVVSAGVRLATGAAVTHDLADGQVRYGGVGHAIGALIAQQTGAETRVTVLGHVQRGGIPNSLDRVLATTLGCAAVGLVAQGKTDRVVTWQRGAVVDVPLNEVAGQTRCLSPDHSMVQTARKMGICLGD